MRLLELQRGALGLPARERYSWESQSGDESPPVELPEEPARGSMLAVEAAAHPSEGVIPGAVVTLTLSVANEGSEGAEDVVAGVPLPGATAYRPGTFVWNGRPTYDDLAEAFFTSGLTVGAIRAGERATFTWKVGVRLGTKPLVIAPFVRARSSAIVGARPVTISRKASSQAFGDEVARAGSALPDVKPVVTAGVSVADLPIYELDPEEQLVYEATDYALSSAASKTPPQEPVVHVHSEAVAEVRSEPEPVAEVRSEPEPVAEAVEPQPPELPAPPPREAIVLAGRFDRATLAFFERVVQRPEGTSLLQHCIFAGALACTVDADGNDVVSLRRHVDAQSQLLHRIVLHEKLGKREPLANYAGELLAHAQRLAPRPVAETPSAKDALALVTELSEPTLAVLNRIAEERDRWDFVKARQLTLALQAQTVAGTDPRIRERLEAALRLYAQASVTALQKLFVRFRVDRTTALLFVSEPPLDAAANALIAALRAALT
ncbi:MAG TPA: hypothetical protein VMF61_16990 [Candidatus Acidoferrales bacterium]|nr:hypothetical protein [Candidatus Acidoferrales bacterium]